MAKQHPSPVTEYGVTAFVAEHRHTITNALNNHAARMNSAAKTAQEGYQAGQDDPQIKAQQDASLMTNAGLRMSAEIFEQDAAKARTVAHELDSMMDRYEGYDND